jgi:hypothetical protein
VRPVTVEPYGEDYLVDDLYLEIVFVRLVTVVPYSEDYLVDDFLS